PRATRADEIRPSPRRVRRRAAGLRGVRRGAHAPSLALCGRGAFNARVLRTGDAPPRGRIAMIGRSIAVVVLVIGLASSSAADEPKAFNCTFTEGVTHSYNNGAFIAEKASPLMFGIAAIDAKAQSAELKTRGGTGQLRIVQAVNAMHFLEVV